MQQSKQGLAIQTWVPAHQMTMPWYDGQLQPTALLKICRWGANSTNLRSKIPGIRSGTSPSKIPLDWGSYDHQCCSAVCDMNYWSPMDIITYVPMIVIHRYPMLTAGFSYIFLAGRLITRALGIASNLVSSRVSPRPSRGAQQGGGRVFRVSMDCSKYVCMKYV